LREGQQAEAREKHEHSPGMHGLFSHSRITQAPKARYSESSTRQLLQILVKKPATPS
jgi:hypothetical protein